MRYSVSEIKRRILLNFKEEDRDHIAPQLERFSMGQLRNMLARLLKEKNDVDKEIRRHSSDV